MDPTTTATNKRKEDVLKDASATIKNDDVKVNKEEKKDKIPESDIQLEYESSTVIPISRRVFDTLLNESTIVTDYSIFYFKNGVRKTNDKIQLKTTLRRLNVMQIVNYKDRFTFLPIVRSSAQEIPALIPQQKYEISTVIKRFVVHQEDYKEYKIRIALEYRSTEIVGSTHHITAEVEYDDAVFHYHEAIKPVETILFKTLMSKFGDVIIKIPTNEIFTYKNMENIFNVPSRVFSSFSNGYSISKIEVKTYKWDGYKGRFFIQNKQMYFCDDLHNMSCGVCPELEEFENIFFQVEIIENNLIITDVLGGYIGNETTAKNLYMPEPLDVLLFFHNLRLKCMKMNIVEPFSLDLKDLAVFSVRTQFHLQNNSPTAKSLNLPHDGYLITTPNRIYKFKIPTLDVRAINGALHINRKFGAISPQIFRDSNGQLLGQTSQADIYEIAPNLTSSSTNSMQFVILKKRYDRKSTSTPTQLTMFLNEIEYLKGFSK
ncbi:LEF-4 [Dikerogammarus haemobaphes nudivirus]|nr:LEF-4 [Dikerogammarus haemobaphes nudivirus]